MPAYALSPIKISILRRMSDDSPSPDGSPIDPGLFDDANQLLQLGLLERNAAAGKITVSEDGEHFLAAIDAHEEGES